MKLLSSILALVLITASLVSQAGPLDDYAQNSVGGTGSVKFVGNSAKFQGLYIYACNYSASDACRQENADTVCRKFGFNEALGWSAISGYEAKLTEETLLWEPGERGSEIVLNKIKAGRLLSPKVFTALQCAY